MSHVRMKKSPNGFARAIPWAFLCSILAAPSLFEDGLLEPNFHNVLYGSSSADSNEVPAIIENRFEVVAERLIELQAMSLDQEKQIHNITVTLDKLAAASPTDHSRPDLQPPASPDSVLSALRSTPSSVSLSLMRSPSTFSTYTNTENVIP